MEAINKENENEALLESLITARDILHRNRNIIEIIDLIHFGSRVYGTFDNNSDYDFIAIVKMLPGTQNLYIDGNYTYHLYSQDVFQQLLNNHDIQALEVYFSPTFAQTSFFYNSKIDDRYLLHLDKTKLRESISTVSSNSWVKGKKKLTIMADYDLRLALKSIFHSIRILDFGIQIAAHGEIYNFSKMNYILEDIWKMSKHSDMFDLWDLIDTKYRKVFNSLKSEFVKLCPKDSTKPEKKYLIKELFRKYDVKSSDDQSFLFELLNLF